MKKFKIAYLYYDLMNLYGENGNIRYLKEKLKEQDIDVIIDYLTINDKITSNYDLYYIGQGSEENELLVLNDIKKYKDELDKAIENNKYFICTGNSLDLFGYNYYKDNDVTRALEVLPYSINYDDDRMVGEQYFKTDLIKHSIIGFMNKSTEIEDLNLLKYKTDKEVKPLFEVIDGYGYNIDDKKYDGIRYKNFYGTYLIGPFLVRNPYFTDYLIEDICKYLDIKYKKLNRDTYPYLAYNEYLNNFYEKITN